MSRSRKSPVEKYVVTTEKPRTVAIAAGAFVGGMLVMWVMMHFFAAAPAVKPTPATKGAPDVAGMPAAQAAAMLGNWEFDHANWSAAVQHYERAIAAGLDTPDVHTDLGTAYKNIGNGDRALTEYGIAQHKDPFHQNSLFNKAIVYAELLHDHPKAIAAAREYLRRFPQGHGSDSARAIISQLEAASPNVEKKLSEFLSAPQPVRPQP
ncbi:MAG: tetratricopeptide repeat protein [Chthoniobacteraceae bacterium]